MFTDESHFVHILVKFSLLLISLAKVLPNGFSPFLSPKYPNASDPLLHGEILLYSCGFIPSHPFDHFHW
jgi:hypothetical protein